MKSTRAVYMALAGLLMLAGGAAAQTGEWQVLKGQHFIVNYRSDKTFAEETLRTAEKYYKQIAEDLGYARQDRFWLWENRAKIFIFEDRDSFAKATGAPEWASAKANYALKEISGFRDAVSFIGIHLPHEMAHLIFRDFVGFKGDIPHWLNEGVAMRAETSARAEAETLVAEWAGRGELIGLKQLTTVDIVHTEDPALAKRFYLQSVSLVGYMIERLGAERFQKFCKALRDGMALEAALRTSYGESAGTMEALETGWKQSLAGKRAAQGGGGR